jgi:transposase
MPATSHPPKHLVREYLERRSRDPKPPPSPEEVRRLLGWSMLIPAAVTLATTR